MHKRINNVEIARYVNLPTAAAYLSMGLTNAKKALVAIGAEKRIGKRCVYDLKVIDEYFANTDSIDLATKK